MDIREMVNDIQRLWDEIDVRQERRRKLAERMGKELGVLFIAAWRAAFPQATCKVLPSSAGDGVLFFYEVAAYSPERGMNDTYFLLEGGGWGKPDALDEHGFGLPVEGPFPYMELETFFRSFEESNPGVKIDLATLKTRKGVAEEGVVWSFREVAIHHAGKDVQLVGQGKKWHVGWDIADQYIIVKVDGVQEVWWSTDGHGGPMTHRAIEGTPEWDKFQEWVGE